MAKAAKPKNPYDAQHLANLKKYEGRIKEFFELAAEEMASRGYKTNHSAGDEDFKAILEDLWDTGDVYQEILGDLYSGVHKTIVSGIKEEWALANSKNDALVRQIFGDKINKDLSKQMRERYFGGNTDVQQAFVERKEKGMELSDQVWNLTKKNQKEMEMGLALGLKEGRTAAELSRDLRSYLNNPDALFRRVRREPGGPLVLSKHAREYRPGRGVYRSAYKNALRLASTEINIAYRTADHERWSKMDFVVGIHIGLSNNHTCAGFRGKDWSDICDTLEGDYPKDFKFTGWHPHCRCIATTILKSDDELEEDNRRIAEGEEPTAPEDSENFVGETPEGFNGWVAENRERIGAADKAGTLPYFIADNQDCVNGITQVFAHGQELLEEGQKYGMAGLPLKKALEENDLAGVRENTGMMERAIATTKRLKGIKDEPEETETPKKELPKTLREIDEAIAKFEYNDPALVARRDEIEAKFKQLFENNDFGLDINSELLGSVFEKGFLNTFEVGRSAGYEGSSRTSGKIEEKHRRLVAEQRMFVPSTQKYLDKYDNTYSGPQLERSEYPKYGHLLDRDKTRDWLGNNSEYGYNDDGEDMRAAVRFKKDRVNCTWTFDDSLMMGAGNMRGKYAQPSLVSDPKVESIDEALTHYFGSDPSRYKSIDKWLESKDWNNLPDLQSKLETGYVELQFHGKLTIDDVESITLKASPEDVLGQDLVDKLLDKGIELWYWNGSEVVQYTGKPTALEIAEQRHAARTPE